MRKRDEASKKILGASPELRDVRPEIPMTEYRMKIGGFQARDRMGEEAIILERKG